LPDDTGAKPDPDPSGLLGDTGERPGPFGDPGSSPGDGKEPPVLGVGASGKSPEPGEGLESGGKDSAHEPHS